MSIERNSSNIQAAVLRDCALKLRVAYKLPRSLAMSELEQLADGDVHIDEFSKFVKGASDHFKFRISEYSLVNGTVGGCALMVTFGKLGADADPHDREWLERYLSKNVGPIEFVEPELRQAS